MSPYDTQTPYSASPYLEQIGSMLRSILSRPASAEVIPAEPGTAPVLGQVQQQYGPLYGLVNALPQNVDVFAGQQARPILARDQSWGMSLYPPSIPAGQEPGDVELRKKLRVPINDIGVLATGGSGMASMFGQRAPIGPSDEPFTIAHEFGHIAKDTLFPWGAPTSSATSKFLKDLKSQKVEPEEMLADLLAWNPDENDLRTFLKERYPKMNADNSVQALSEILGHASKMFTGPPSPYTRY